jgi:hypothetical protein
VLYRASPGPTAPREKRRRRSAVPGDVWKLAGLFSVDAFAGGFMINSLMALWLFERFSLSLTAAGAFFFWTGC